MSKKSFIDRFFIVQVIHNNKKSYVIHHIFPLYSSFAEMLYLGFPRSALSSFWKWIKCYKQKQKAVSIIQL